jgi:enamine deaminase RidA (YjgF/YER057c/UK114 family)
LFSSQAKLAGTRTNGLKARTLSLRSVGLENVVSVVQEAGGTPEHVTRLTWFITDKAEYVSRLHEIGEARRSVMGKHFPAMTMVQVAALVEDEARVEIEACAVLPK